MPSATGKPDTRSTRAVGAAAVAAGGIYAATWDDDSASPGAAPYVGGDLHTTCRCRRAPPRPASTPAPMTGGLGPRPEHQPFRRGFPPGQGQRQAALGTLAARRGVGARGRRPGRSDPHRAGRPRTSGRPATRPTTPGHPHPSRHLAPGGGGRRRQPHPRFPDGRVLPARRSVPRARPGPARLGVPGSERAD